MLIDVTRLVHRALKGFLPTGVDRVSNAYIAHYGHCAAALIRVGSNWVVPSPHESQRVFDLLLLNPDQRSRAKLVGTVLRGLVCPSGRASDEILINAGHSGLEHGN